MRCPKCGYISFDNEEICSGCKKNIAKTSQELAGASFKAAVPDFLQFGSEEKEEDQEEEASSDEGEQDEGLDMGEDASKTEGEGFDAEDTVEFSADADVDSGEAEEESKEIEFDLSGGGDAGEMELDLSGGEEPTPEKNAGQSDGMDLQLDGGAGLDLSIEDAGDLEFSLDSDVETELDLDSPAPKVPKPAPEKSVKKDKASALDLSGMDLSGLMPEPAESDDFSIGELSLEGSEPAAGGKTKKSGGGGAAASAAGLPDLEFEGIDFNAATLPPAGSASGKKLRPAAKTGTALDNFDVDLGELVAGKPVSAKKPVAAKPAAPARKK